MRSSFPPTDDGCGRSSTTMMTDYRRPSTSTNRYYSSRSPPPTHRHSPNHYPNSRYRCDRTQPPSNSPSGTRTRPNFIVQLVDNQTKLSFPDRVEEIKSLASLCEIPEEPLRVPQFGCIAGSFSFKQWVDALSALVSLWDYRLQGRHDFVPELISNVIVPSDMDELRDRLRYLFLGHVLEVMENGECVKKVRSEIDEKSRRVESFASKRGVRIEVYAKKKAVERETDLVVKRLEEFKNAMKSIVRFLEGKDKGECDGGEEEVVGVFGLEGGYDWKRIHSLIRRECRRLEDGLPIYAYRRDILKRIHGEQVSPKPY